MKKYYIKTIRNNKNLLKVLLVAIALGNSLITFGQVRVNFEPRTTPAIFNVKGDFTMIGNTNLTLVDYSDNGTNNANMKYVDVDNENNTFNSSSATLNFSTENGADPNCSQIVFAGLYWTGRASNGSSSPNTFEVTKEVPGGSQTVNVNETVGHNDNVEYSNYALSVSRQGNSNNYYPRYTFTGNGNTYDFEYRNNESNADNIRVRFNGGSWTNVLATYSNSGNTGTATLTTPYTITDGTITITINKLLRDTRTNRNESQYRETSFAEVNISGTVQGTVTITKTFDKRKVLLKGPSAGTYSTITANSNDIYYPTTSDGFMYSAYADITTYVQNNGLGDYFVADIALVEGNGGGTGFYGGWGIVVVYENSKMNWRDVTVFDGHSYVAGGITADFEIPVSGFNTAQSGPVNMKLGMMAGEGDRGISGDFFQIRNATNTNWVTLNHGGNSSNNFFNSSIYTGGNTRSPNLLNNTGMDVSMFDIDNPGNTVVSNNQTSTSFRYGTTQDTYVIFNITMSVDSYVPEAEAIISATTINGNPVNAPPYTVEPGQEMEFEVDLINIGTEDLNNTIIRVPIPFASTYVPGSATTSIFFTPSPTPNTITFDPNQGSNGTLIWNLGTLPQGVNPEDILGKLKFKLKLTEDCLLLQQSGCVNSIPVNGTITGVGAISGVLLNNQQFIQGYEAGSCEGQTISAPIIINVDSASYIAANCTPINLTFTFCSPNNDPIPVSEVGTTFPTGTQFFAQFPGGSPITSFPVNANVTTYYAVPAGAPNNCVIEFTVQFFCGNPSIEIIKSASPSTYSASGDVITYTLTVTNTGNVTLTDVIVNDPLTGFSTTIAEMLPGEVEVFTTTYTITQSDVNNGSVLNTATAIGEDPNGDPIEDDDDETVTANQNPSIAIVKTFKIEGDDPCTVLGGIITYRMFVTNEGNVTLSNVVISDPLLGGVISGPMIGDNNNNGLLDINEVWTYTGVYIITQDDIDAGQIVNQAIATAEDPNGDEVSDLSGTSVENDDPTITELCQ
ncbi:MAG: hypothetical protein CO068_05580, partial [Flavobacteriaceae bacterium CG_4_9_14_0_8_um_filter_34_30]